ncbi:hypothetical protein NBRC110019_05030 [Neptunitalea chrysea]|uniref:HTH araC/xylS-type domain-containing protein n=1 Tax=Neptunitalea chrysea TaxID=1647581 RepID=A0A9W6B535_9FLAO|nr:response regulator transcription factor [Neptunitalea chrysea]GLB51464.1 hypothetical protein NBRC110019_05030 [Neptunitalea chrysea]
MEFHVKNMVCDRCIMVVREDFESVGFTVSDIDLGTIVTKEESFSVDQKIALKSKLEGHGFQFLKSEDEIVSDKIKTALLHYINKELLSEKLSDYLKTKLHKDYGVLSKQFSKHNHVTIEKYFIKLKIEKAKQYIREDVYNFSEIAGVLGYNSLSYLSTQFKKETGVSLSEFKSNPELQRNTLDKIL